MPVWVVSFLPVIKFSLSVAMLKCCATGLIVSIKCLYSDKEIVVPGDVCLVFWLVVKRRLLRLIRIIAIAMNIILFLIID